MNRTQALALLQEQPFLRLAQALGQATTDSPDGWKAALDSAYRALGIAEANLTSTTLSAAQIPLFLPLLHLAAFTQLRAIAATRVDSSVAQGQLQLRWSQMAAQLDRFIAAAEQRVQVVRRIVSAAEVLPLTTQSPIEADSPLGPDPNARQYRGDPLRPPGFRVPWKIWEF